MTVNEIECDSISISCRGSKICSPFIQSSQPSKVYYVSSGTGEIYEYCKLTKMHKALLFTGGEPTCAIFHSYNGNGSNNQDLQSILHIADAGHAAILRVDGDYQFNPKPGILVKNYEEKQFKGPTSLIFDNTSLYFTDAGPLGETTLESPKGSLYRIMKNSHTNSQMLYPLATSTFAHPCGLALLPNETNTTIIFFCEMMQNRIIKFIQAPEYGNMYFFSVFYQFSGGIGPSCIACSTNGFIYVGHFDVDLRLKGKVSVISSTTGSLVQVLHVQTSCMITGICLSVDESYLFVTDSLNNTLHEIQLV